MKLADLFESSNITVHDLKGWSGSEAYDITQTDETIKDGDVLDLGNGNVGIQVKAWPTVAFGKIEQFHELDPKKVTWDNVEGGRYKASYVKAQEVAKQK